MKKCHVFVCKDLADVSGVVFLKAISNFDSSCLVFFDRGFICICFYMFEEDSDEDKLVVREFRTPILTPEVLFRKSKKFFSKKNLGKPQKPLGKLSGKLFDYIFALRVSEFYSLR